MGKNNDLHGNAPDESELALLLIDVINDLEFAGNNCVLFTANDGYMRDYNLIISADCTASIKEEENNDALRQMQEVLKADIRPSLEVDFVLRSGRASPARS